MIYTHVVTDVPSCYFGTVYTGNGDFLDMEHASCIHSVCIKVPTHTKRFSQP